MILFATPDFGAGACIYGFLLLVWAIVLALAMTGFFWGLKKFASVFPRARKLGLVLMMASVAIPLLCCFGPSHAVRLKYGNYPLTRYPNNEIHKGMTMDEVTAMLGTPHQRDRHKGEESWYYWLDSFGIGYFGVNFGPDGRVKGTHGN